LTATPDRRAVVGGLVLAAWSSGPAASVAKEPPMYGLIGKMTAQAGQGAALAQVLLEGVSGMPGCLSYVVAADPADADVLWITEVWDSAESHRASLSLPSVQAAIARGRPMIAGMETVAQTKPLGGHGLIA
jgi:quinol monooxygenase YgiN